MSVEAAQMASKQEDRALGLLEGGGVVTLATLRRAGVDWRTVDRLLGRGVIERVGRGAYRLSNAEDHSWESFALLSARHPESVICLVSAAAWHGLTMANPPEVWAAFPYEASIPRGTDFPIRGFRWRGAPMSAGIEERIISGTTVRITSKERTVVDLLRTRNRTGEAEIAIESLRAYLDKGGAIRKLTEMAEALKQSNALRPFMEAAQGFRM